MSHELTLGNVLRRQVTNHGDKIFLTELRTGGTFTYSEINTHANRIWNKGSSCKDTCRGRAMSTSSFGPYPPKKLSVR